MSEWIRNPARSRPATCPTSSSASSRAVSPTSAASITCETSRSASSTVVGVPGSFMSAEPLGKSLALLGLARRVDQLVEPTLQHLVELVDGHADPMVGHAPVGVV